MAVMAVQLAVAVAMSAVSYAMSDRKDVGKRQDRNVFSQYGDSMGYLIGTMRCPCTITWAPELVVKTKNTSQKGFGQKVKEHSYYLNAQLMFSHSATDVILAIINNNKKIYTNESKSSTKSLLASLPNTKNTRFYNGSQQYPDTLIERYEGVGKVSASKNKSYLVVEEFAVGQDTNYQFEVIASTKAKEEPRFEELYSLNNAGSVINILDQNTYQRIKTLSGAGSIVEYEKSIIKSNGEETIPEKKVIYDKSKSVSKPSVWAFSVDLYKNDTQFDVIFGFDSANNTYIFTQENNEPTVFDNVKLGSTVFYVNKNGTTAIYRADNSTQKTLTSINNNLAISKNLTRAVLDIDTSASYIYVTHEDRIVRYSKDLTQETTIYTESITAERVRNIKVINDDIIYFTHHYLSGNRTFGKVKVLRNSVVSNVRNVEINNTYFSSMNELATFDGQSFIITNYASSSTSKIIFLTFTHAGDYLTLEQVVLEIARKHKKDLSLINASDLASIQCFGFYLHLDKSFDEEIKTLSELYCFVKKSTPEGKIIYKRKGGSVVARIKTSEMNATSSENSTDNPLKKLITQDSELTRKVVANFIDKDADYRQASVFAELKHINSEATRTISVNGAFSHDEIRTLIKHVLLTDNIERVKYEFSVAEKWSMLEVTDTIEIEDDLGDGSVRTVRITEINDNNNGIYNIKAVDEDRTIYLQKEVGSPIISRVADVEYLADSLFVPLDIPLLRDQDEGKGMYYAVGPATDDSWRGCTLLTSVDGGISYVTMNELTKDKASVIGTAQSVLADFKLSNNREASHFDLQNSVIVKTNGVEQLKSASIDELKNSRVNYAFLGGEIIQFLNAFPVSGQKNTYRLTGLHRGLQGTESFKSTHTINERFVLLDDKKLQILGYQTSRFDSENYIKAITFGAYEDSATAVKFVYSGQAYECYSPVQVGGGFDNEKAILKWTRRGRMNNSWLNKVDVPLSETTQLFEVDILKNNQVVRTLTSTTTTVNYTNAQIIEDFNSIPNEINFNVYQISSLRNRGHKASGFIKK